MTAPIDERYPAVSLAEYEDLAKSVLCGSVSDDANGITFEFDDDEAIERFLVRRHSDSDTVDVSDEPARAGLVVRLAGPAPQCFCPRPAFVG